MIARILFTLIGAPILAALSVHEQQPLPDVDETRTTKRQRLYSLHVARRADALTAGDVDALFEQLEDERAGGAWR